MKKLLRLTFPLFLFLLTFFPLTALAGENSSSFSGSNGKGAITATPASGATGATLTPEASKKDSTAAAVKARKEALLKKVDDSWSLETTRLPPAIAKESPAQNLRAKLALTKIPSVEIMRVPLSQALGSLTADAPAATNAAGVEEKVSLNFVISGATDPEVSLNLHDTNLLDAIELLVEAAGMNYELRGSTVIVLPLSATGSLKTRYYSISQSLLTRLIGAELVKMTPNQPLSNNKTVEEPPAPIYQHNGAESALKNFFERLGITWPEGSGMVLADGELIVTHNTRTLDRLSEIFARLAIHRQVEIEARFMEIGEGSLNELGVQWNFANQKGNPTGTAGTTGVTAGTVPSLRSLAGAFGAGSAVAGTATPPQVPGNVNLAANTTSNAAITGFIGSSSITGIISALSQQDGTELLSAPRLTVLSGSTANITVAQELRYPQSYDRVNTDVGSGTGTSSGSILTAPTPLDFTTRNVGVQMQVTPYVEDDGSITLILQPEVTEFERFIDYGGQSVVVNGSVTQTVPSGFFQPVFDVRRLTTEVNLPSGATVLLGGLTREENVKVNDKVPLLGDIPFFGKAFQSHGNSTLKKNLVVFVTARLVE